MRTPARSSPLIVWIPVLCGAAAASFVLGRELWFDEAMTITSFMLPLSPAEIYTTYAIPNNQIVYTVLLKCWHGLLLGAYPAPIAFWRLLSLLGAGAAALVFFSLRRRLHDRTPAAAASVLTVFALSAVFQNYATALRGYAVSWLWVMLALDGAWRIFHGKTASGWCLYAIGAVAAVGTVPTNLLTCAGVVVYAFPWSRRDWWCDWRLWLLSAGPFLALAVFYSPILKAFLHAFTLNEGFPSRAGALAVVYGAVSATFGLLLTAEGFRLTRGDWRRKLRIAIWFLPVPAILLLHKAPFPRVFCTLFPLYLMLLADGLALIRRPSRAVLATGAGAVLVSVIVLRFLAPVTAEAAGLSEYDDDYFRPWYMARDYSVCELLPALADHPELPVVFQSFNSDPCPLIFYATLQDVEKDFRPDQPPGHVKSLPARALVVLRRDETPGDYETRFGGALTLLFTGRDCTVWRFDRAAAPPGS